MNFFGPKPTNISHAEQELRPLLMNEGCQVLSTFDLNKVASLTYGDAVCDDIFEMIESILAQPLNYTPLTIHKALVVLKHVLIYGSAKCVNSGYGIAKFVETLMTFNTVLAAQQKQGASAFLQRLQGGGVDKGGPIREEATAVHKLLQNINELQRIRNESASKESLVPIGDDQIAFLTDEVRHYILRKRIEQQQQIEIKSNLAKSQGGFGGGYSAKDGKSVVGAAHGIEEMIKMAKRDTKKFTDEGKSGPTEEDRILDELAAEDKRQKALAKAEADAAAAAKNEALLESRAAPLPTTGDLLDFSAPVSAPSPTDTGDLLGGFGSGTPSDGNMDLLGMMSTATPATQSTEGSLLDLAPSMGMVPSNNNDPFGFASMAAPTPSVDPFAAATNTTTTSISQDIGGLPEMMQVMSMNKPASSVMSANEDRFAALDALASTADPPSLAQGHMAEQRLLSGTSSAVTSTSSSKDSSMPTSMPPMPPPDLPPMPPPSPPMGFAVPANAVGSMVTPGMGKVATAYGEDDSNDDDNPWVMGGSVGAGLQPLGPAPSSAPPPPPPSFY
eukprot:Nitzschia sp. Nitz4//scaffold119_size111653//109730//111403//NITZ4_004215-RA/size111653-processed-gene-0.178-mRNA-1//1//CDS//3329533911//2733//frame0